MGHSSLSCCDTRIFLKMSRNTPELRMSERQVTPDKSKIFYVDDFMFGNNLRQRPKKPPREITIGMEKINAKTMIGKYWVHYANTCTFHGINHLTAPRRHILERVITVIALVLALTALLVLSLVFWTRFQTAAAITIVDHNYRKFTIVKPSIIFCPTPSIDKDKFPEVFQKYKVNNTMEARQFFTTISGIAYPQWNRIPDYKATNPKLWASILNDLRPDVQYEVGNSTSVWTLTEVGFCIASNNYVSEYSNFEYWQNDNWTVIPRPENLSLITYKNWELTDGVKVLTHGIKYTVVFPGDVFNYLEHKMFRAPRRSMMKIDFLPAEIVASEEVKALSIAQRDCMFPHERRLNMYPIYRESMCFMECRFNKMLEFCGCYPHFVRPTPGVPVCNVNQLKCIYKHLSDVLFIKGDIGQICDCLGDCETTRYTDDSILPTILKEGSPMDTIVTIGIILPLDKFIRKQIFGFNDFLVSVGGAAGLFLGASVLSFAEIIYFATLRLFWYLVGIWRINKAEKRKKKRMLEMQQMSSLSGYQKKSSRRKSARKVAHKFE